MNKKNSKILNFFFKSVLYLSGFFIFLYLNPYLTTLNILYLMCTVLFILILFIFNNLIYVFYLNKFMINKKIEINKFVPKYTRDELVRLKKTGKEHLSLMIDIYTRGAISLLILIPFFIIIILILAFLN